MTIFQDTPKVDVYAPPAAIDYRGPEQIRFPVMSDTRGKTLWLYSLDAARLEADI